jgi:histidyl-tRNA synthetase
LEFLDSRQISYFLNTNLVRGLDYYTRTVFEIFEDREGASDALAAGGRYDYLAKTLGKKDFPAAGGAIGVDRTVELMKEKKIAAKHKRPAKVFLVQLGTAAKYKSLEIIEMFRKAHLPLSQSISKDSLRGQLKLAGKFNAPYALILGQKEALENSIIVRDMESGTQESVAIEKVVEVIKNKIK